MKNISKLFLIVLTGMFVSCETELDINTDPNSPPNITTGLALTSAQASLVTVMGGDLTNLGGFYAQYHTQAPAASQYLTIDQNNISTTYANRLWTELYAGCLFDLKYVVDESTKNGDTGTALIGTVTSAYTFQILTDVFGNIPYAEALQGVSNLTPNSTPQEQIYADLIVKIDAALAAYEDNPVPTLVEEQDTFFGGDMDAWIRFANTLKLKMYIRQSYTSAANPAAVNALLAEDNFLTQDVAFTNFGSSQNQRNPFYEVQIDYLGDVNNIASNSILEFYELNSDPRAAAAFRQNNATVYVGLPQGAGPETVALPAAFSRPRITATTPVYLMTVAESNFLQAEALIRYAGGAGAKAKYDAGVTASFDTYGLNTADAAPFLATGGAYEYQTAGTIEATVRQVIIQKWAALTYVNNIESYIETKRTKFPEVVTEGTENYAIGNRIRSRVSVISGNTVPSIIYYPQDEVNRNPNITQHTSLTQKVWWDQK